MGWRFNSWLGIYWPNMSEVRTNRVSVDLSAEFSTFIQTKHLKSGWSMSENDEHK